MWENVFAIDNNESGQLQSRNAPTIETIFPPLPPGAVLLSDEIIERTSTIPEHHPYIISSTNKLKKKRKRNKKNKIDSRQFEEAILHELGFPVQHNKKNMGEVIDRRTGDKLAPPNNHKYKTQQLIQEIKTINSNGKRKSKQASKNSPIAYRESLEAHQLNNRKRHKSLDQQIQPRSQDNHGYIEKNEHKKQVYKERRRTLSDNCLDRKNQDLVPVELKDHAMNDDIRPLSRRKAIKISDNLICVPGIERIIEKRFYVKTNKNSNNNRKPNSDTQEQNLKIEMKGNQTHDDKNFKTLIEEMQRIKSDIQVLHRKHAELLDETRSLKPSFSTLNDRNINDAVVQTDLETDNSRRSISTQRHYVNTVKDLHSSSSESSDETIKNFSNAHLAGNIKSMSPIGSHLQRDVPLAPTLKNSNHISVTLASDHSDHMDSIQSSNYYNSSSDLKIPFPTNNNSMQNAISNNYENINRNDLLVNQQDNNANNTAMTKRVFRVEPPPSQPITFQTQSELPLHHHQQQQQPPRPQQQQQRQMFSNQNDVYQRALVDQTYTWPQGYHQEAFSLDTIPEYNNYQNIQQLQKPPSMQQRASMTLYPPRENQQMRQVKNQISEYDKMFKEAYGMTSATNNFDSTAMKSLQTATLSYASMDEDNTFVEQVPTNSMDNVFSLIEPSLSYQDDSFQIEQKSNNLYKRNSQTLDHHLIQPKRNDHTFEDLVRQYNTLSVKNQQQQKYTGGYIANDRLRPQATNRHSLINSSSTINSNRLYENFIC